MVLKIGGPLCLKATCGIIPVGGVAATGMRIINVRATNVVPFADEKCKESADDLRSRLFLFYHPATIVHG